ncbi:MAG: hypothetical protein R3F10_12080 [Lysobacteraceae bacterium]
MTTPLDGLHEGTDAVHQSGNDTRIFGLVFVGSEVQRHESFYFRCICEGLFLFEHRRGPVTFSLDPRKRRR